MQIRWRNLWLGAAAALLSGMAVHPVAAQVAGLPVMNTGLPAGAGVSIDAGIPNAAAGSGWAAGATGRVGTGILGATATVSRVMPDGGVDQWSYGGTGNFKVFGGPLVPISVTLQAGAAVIKACIPESSCDGTEQVYHYPVGVGFAVVVPNPALAIKPWIAPRADITRASGETTTRFGISAGVELNFINGFGLHAAYDWVKGDGANPGILGAGLHYTFRVPGL